ncbi:asparagine synthetase B family protein [Polaribacter glomeratus]|uniref:asparagine synthase (glutamine-hydrolyzing) n=1 Tax=Polaribacter glomeratus TaxID=102 RepID=A0A2S7WYC7_9FLAO|nr:asparagine synthetase B family protein [Polaribacter glomeratus]PQJ82584.1 asparagine synthase [Polaribacter glomeratus]TXD64960.1 asparagine synthetase B family protein [Polaribacter glomeratus]
MNITLKHNKGFEWFKNDSFILKGYFFIDDEFYERENALNYLIIIKNKSDFKEFLYKINGVFTILFSDKKTVYIASDITRSFPVFYTFQDHKVFISDDILYLKNTFNIDDFDALAEIELKASNHTHGKKTLLKDVFQVQASEYIIIKNDQLIESDFFYSYAIQKESSDANQTLKNNATTAFENAFKRFLKSLKNRTVVVPLSGGFDSRLIAVLLKKFNYKNVLCYTYGRKDSFEIENSKKTAEQLNFKWIFIEYNTQLIDGYLETAEFKEYAHFAGKLSSMPNLQEYFAVNYLKEKSLIPEDAIFIPGYAGDLLGGSQFLKVIPENLKHSQIADLIIEQKLSNYSLSTSKKKTLKHEIEKRLQNFDQNYLEKIPSSVFEDYDIKEKIAKYIFNSANFYTYFGFEHRFPFWDKELLNFFKQLPVKQKLMKTFFNDVLINEYFKPYNIHFESELQPSEKGIQTQKIKEKLKPFLPTFIKQKFLLKNDWVNYKPLTDEMIKLIKSKGLTVSKLSKNYNEVVVQWYLYYSKNELK